MRDQTAAIVIGRNEGPRLIACLDALQGQVARIIYVDSGSTDDSVQAARVRGAEVVSLDMSVPFTAARARNAGLAQLASKTTQFVQFLDGDCVIRDGWLDTALAFLNSHPAAVVVCGRRRERYPEASFYNHLADKEWNTPPGPARACGGDALMRLDAVTAVNGYRPDLIAGEEPELCLRLARAGGEIWRLDVEMTWHDANLTRLSQWWKRTVRAGHAFAEGAALHGSGPERHWVRETRRALLWGAVLPLILLIGLLINPCAALILLAIYPAQVARLAARQKFTRIAWGEAFFSVLGKFAEAQGVITYYLNRRRGRRTRLLEYK